MRAHLAPVAEVPAVIPPLTSHAADSADGSDSPEEVRCAEERHADRPLGGLRRGLGQRRLRGGEPRQRPVHRCGTRPRRLPASPTRPATSRFTRSRREPTPPSRPRPPARHTADAEQDPDRRLDSGQLARQPDSSVAVKRGIPTRGGYVSATCRGGLVSVGAAPAVWWQVDSLTPRSGAAPPGCASSRHRTRTANGSRSPRRCAQRHHRPSAPSTSRAAAADGGGGGRRRLGRVGGSGGSDDSSGSGSG